MTYKPGYELTLQCLNGLDRNGYNSPVARIDVKAVIDNSRSPGTPFNLYFQQLIPVYEELITEDHITQYLVRNALRELECHEVDEWFRLDGKLVTDPHLGPMT